VHIFAARMEVRIPHIYLERELVVIAGFMSFWA
jgi:hypothetical protein